MKAYLVGTDRQALWFGYSEDEVIPGNAPVRLVRARQVVYWSADMRGAGGLAVTGPTRTCRIGPAVPVVVLSGVVTVMACAEAAVAAHEAAPWA